ncbi:MAG: hypothetical protein ACREN2_07955 [Candidatus Dormibacteria bacterium]
MNDGQLVAANILWDIALLLVIAFIVPLLMFRAARMVSAARAIAIEFKVTLTAAGGIARNTQPTAAALDQTIQVAGAILGTAGQINEHSGAIETLLTSRAAGGRR